jgi:hypothetical protein
MAARGLTPSRGVRPAGGYGLGDSVGRKNRVQAVIRSRVKMGEPHTHSLARANTGNLSRGEFAGDGVGLCPVARTPAGSALLRVAVPSGGTHSS